MSLVEGNVSHSSTHIGSLSFEYEEDKLTQGQPAAHLGKNESNAIQGRTRATKTLEEGKPVFLKPRNAGVGYVPRGWHWLHLSGCARTSERGKGGCAHTKGFQVSAQDGGGKIAV